MQIEERNEEGTIVLIVSGKLLAGANGDRLRQTVARHIAAGYKEIVLDLAGLTYIDSSGLGELVQCRTLLSSKNGKLKLRNLPKRVYDRLSVMRLESLFTNDDADDPRGAAD